MKFVLGFLIWLVMASPLAAQSNESYLVVLNRPGPAWERVSEYAAESRQHFEIYKRLADAGLIIAGGKLVGGPGDPLLGISIFRSDVDRESIRHTLSDDPLLKAGVTALEYREWTVQMGSIGGGGR